MNYLIIAGWDANNHPVRTNIMETLEEADALVIAADRKNPLVVIRLDDFCDLYNNKEKS